mmetsp:Transcript_35193/g.78936  ORF Transcript_35193/g.78936 Transcript_35193/m.78936 type:complete len:920 (+) Transcript_35193:47-2806(+)
MTTKQSDIGDIEDAGGDTLGDLPDLSSPPAPPPTRTLQGIEGVLSSRGFNSDAGDPSGGGEGGAAAAGGDKPASFADYLAAQRALKKQSSSRRFAPGSIPTEPAPGNGDGDVGGGAGGDPVMPASLGTFNPALLTAATRLKSKAAVAKKKVADRSAAEMRVVQALGAMGRRGAASEFDMEGLDEDGHFAGDGDHGEVSLPFYAPPVQRQRWGEDQVLPHVNWGDLFFDLFYVGMAYNLGVMLTSAVDDLTFLRGFIYFVACFGTLWTSWENIMFYESRYTTVDYFHRMFEVVRFMFVSLAIVHVGSIENMSDGKSSETMVFCIAALGEGLMYLGQRVELLLRGQGDRDAITNHTKRMIKYTIPTLLLYTAALAVSIWLYTRPEDEPHGRLLADPVDDKSSNYNSDYKSSNYNSDYGSSAWRIDDLPLTLMAVAWIQNIVCTYFLELRATNGKHGDVRTQLVPSNIDYVIHRYGEWCLLMIGEGILSLVIVETAETADYYIITTFGTLTMIFIQILKFESEPSHAEGHALWKDIRNGKFYSYLVQILSMSLIVFGVMYKVFLKKVLKSYKAETSYAAHRFLAGGGSYMSDETSAALFCGGLTALLLSLELMNLTHSGVMKSDLLGRITKESGDVDWTMVTVMILKICIVIFTVTLQYWTTDPDAMTLCGCAIVFAMASTRVFVHYYLHKRSVLLQLTDNLTSTAKKAAETLRTENLTSTAKRAAETLSSSAKTVPGAVLSLSLSEPKRSVGENDAKLNSTEKKDSESKPSGKSSQQGALASSLASLVKRASDQADSSQDLYSPAAHKQKEAIQRVVDDHSFDAIIASNKAGTILNVNKQAVKDFGYKSGSDLVGKKVTILFQHIDGSPEKLTENEGKQLVETFTMENGTSMKCIIASKSIAGAQDCVVTYVRSLETIQGL